jgi:hypothetical protein
MNSLSNRDEVSHASRVRAGTGYAKEAVGVANEYNKNQRGCVFTLFVNDILGCIGAAARRAR